MSKISEGWTDDMNVPLPPERTVEEITDFVIQQALLGIDDEENENRLISTFGFLPEDAALIRDRVFGGIVRAAMGNTSNKPDAKKDPFAYISYKKTLQDRLIITSIYPQFEQSNRRPWWKFW